MVGTHPLSLSRPSETHKQDPVIVSFARTPIGKFQGGLAALSAPQLGAAVVKEAVARACKRVARTPVLAASRPGIRERALTD